MSERKHTPTPGPWRVNKYGSIGAGERGTEPIVAMVEPFYSVDKRHGDHAANARLIAACPTMYAYIAKKAQDGDADAARILAAL